MHSLSGLLIFLCVIIISVSDQPVTAQHPDSSAKRISYRKQKKIQANKQIKELKEGTLLVMLHTKSQSVAALRKMGNVRLANKIESKQYVFNAQVISAFKTYFTYCPTRFFFTDDAQFIVDGQIEKVSFLNDNMQHDPGLKMEMPFFYIADFGKILQDTAQFYSGSTKQTDGNWNIRKAPVYYGSSGRGFNGLVIMDKNFKQLRRPLKFYARTFDPLFFKRSPEKTVIRLNRKLRRYYNKNIAASPLLKQG